MRLRALNAVNVNPVKLFSVKDLSDVVVFAGPNGVGKTRLVETTLACFRNPSEYRGQGSKPDMQLFIDATSPAEKQEWGKDQLDTADTADAGKLLTTLQRARQRSKWRSSVLNFESDRTILQIQPYQFTWESRDPFQENVGWDLSFSRLRDRFQDTLHSMFRMVRSRRESIAQRVEELVRNRERLQQHRATEVLDQLDKDFPD